MSLKARGTPASVVNSQSTVANQKPVSDGAGNYAWVADAINPMAPKYGAKADVKLVTDGSITSGQAALTSASAAFTVADVGKTVLVTGAGTTGKVLATTISAYVSATQVTLAANASTTVSGASVRYGTDDTTAVQNAINDASSAIVASGMVVLNPGHNFGIKSLTPKSNVTIWAYGSQITPLLANLLNPPQGRAQDALFYVPAAGPYVSRFSVFGLTVAGASDNSQANALLTMTGCTDLQFEDWYVTNHYGTIWNINDSQRYRVSNNTAINCGFATGNANVLEAGGISGAAVQNTSDVLIERNIMLGMNATAIGVVEPNSGTATISRVRIAGNVITGTSTAIDIEIDSPWVSQQLQEIVVDGNVMEMTSGVWQLPAIYILRSGLAGDGFPTAIDRILVSHNVVKTNQVGIQADASHVDVVDNIVNAGGSGITVGNANLGIGATGDLASGSPNVANVAGSGNNLDAVANGDLVWGNANVVPGSYIVSGAPPQQITVNGGQTLTGVADTLTVNTTTGMPTAGTFTVPGVAGTVTYTGKTATTFTGCSSAGGTVANGAVVTSTTWVLNNNATGTVTGYGVTVYLAMHDFTIKGNVIALPASGSQHGIYLYGANYFAVHDNYVYGVTNPASNSGEGIRAFYTGWGEIQDNRVYNAPGDGIHWERGHDTRTQGNRVYNPTSGAAGGDGIHFTNISGISNLVEGNYANDDRGSSALMAYGLFSDGTNSNFHVRGNSTRGGTSTGSRIDSGHGLVDGRDNSYTSGAVSGRATLVAGTVTVSTTEIQAGDNVILTRVSAGGTVGVPQVGTITAGTSFVINSVQPGTASTLQNADTSVIYWRIDH